MVLYKYILLVHLFPIGQNIIYLVVPGLYRNGIQRNMYKLVYTMFFGRNYD